MIPSKLVRGSDSSRGFFYTHSGKGGMPLCEIDADHVLDELAEIAFAVPGEEGGLPVKVTDKLRAQGIEAGIFPRPKKMGKFLNRLQE